ncbi:phosphatidylserine lipase ABHD16A-like [Polyodon spathula]|uniref:phosphatidylserine lipase ABHD16A-like n=1 Tax=Polyodon spathula TaxID=7913 RepID=UPI001B7DD747|nr:phosphatidylserine lipase ABHD16A-like [Polyodon spathula]
MQVRACILKHCCSLCELDSGWYIKLLKPNLYVLCFIFSPPPQCGGQRAKLVACDGNAIDTMFVDKRDSQGEKGKKLVNILTWDGGSKEYLAVLLLHPGHRSSIVLSSPPCFPTVSLEKCSGGLNKSDLNGNSISRVSLVCLQGVSFPQNEASAMDVVVQYAVHKLGFELKDIVIYAWSIGGFTATWAAMSYPEVSALVLDASFDDLLPLALKVMPESWSPEDIMSNRGHYLLLRLLQFRYPKVMTEEGVRAVREWLGASSAVEEASVYSRYEMDDDWCTSVLQSYQTDQTTEFPWTVGNDMTFEGRRQLALFLARKHMRNFDATHCTPLPPYEFQSPWRL